MITKILIFIYFFQYETVRILKIFHFWGSYKFPLDLKLHLILVLSALFWSSLGLKWKAISASGTARPQCRLRPNLTASSDCCILTWTNNELSTPKPFSRLWTIGRGRPETLMDCVKTWNWKKCIIALLRC